MTLRVLCDTNVLVSALIADGPPSRILEEVIDGRLALLVPPPVAAELERVLTKKLGFEQAAVADAKTMLARLSTVEAVQPSRIDAVTGDPKDDRILAYAVSTGADVLVTGDRKHLLPLAEYRGVRLITPQALLAELLHADAQTAHAARLWKTDSTFAWDKLGKVYGYLRDFNAAARETIDGV